MDAPGDLLTRTTDCPAWNFWLFILDRGLGRQTGPGGPLRLLLRRGQQTLTLHLLADSLAGTPDRFGLFAGLALGRLLVSLPLPHLTKHTLALHFLFQNAQGLLNVVIADKYLQKPTSGSSYE